MTYGTGAGTPLPNLITTVFALPIMIISPQEMTSRRTNSATGKVARNFHRPYSSHDLGSNLSSRHETKIEYSRARPLPWDTCLNGHQPGRTAILGGYRPVPSNINNWVTTRDDCRLGPYWVIMEDGGWRMEETGQELGRVYAFSRSQLAPAGSGICIDLKIDIRLFTLVSADEPHVVIVLTGLLGGPNMYLSSPSTTGGQSLHGG
ncbi:hypothetical protein EDD18DRAFT_1115225 [Armillaria luteobubalina]|uniref:Uncharacterized protein n=1 Tax=Armillaria luteobubalina TaxID=153913 RepID=A0AA39P2W6_9AGAR|nr:hypothetical protein EDD18DRAFT_1115225 [Armillaria luteobubalina]